MADTCTVDSAVIGFGVGNTLHAALLHPSIRGLETVDLSPHILGHAAYFFATNGGVITHPRVSVYINDGRSPPSADAATRVI